MVSKKYKTLGSNTVLVFIGSASAKVVGLLMLPYYTRWLSMADYGVSDLINVYSTFLLAFVSCCIEAAIFIFPKSKPQLEQASYYSSGIGFITITSVFTAITFVLISFIAPQMGITNAFTQNIWLIFLLLISHVYQGVTQQFTRSINKMLIYSLTGVVITSCTAIFAILLIPAFHLQGYIWSLVLANFCGTLFSFIGSKSYRYISFKNISVIKCKEMLKYSIPLIPNSAMWWLVNSINRPILESYCSYDEIGLFAVAQKFPGILTMLFTVFLTSWQISVIDEYKKEGFNDFSNKILKVITMGSILILLIITLCSELLINIFATKQYVKGAYLIPILTMGVIFSNLGGLIATIFSAVRISKYYFYSSAWAAMAAILANAVLIPLLGITGAALSTMLSMLVMAVARLFYSRKFVKWEWSSLYPFLFLFSILVYIMVMKKINVLFIVLIIVFAYGALAYYNRLQLQRFFNQLKRKNRY